MHQSEFSEKERVTVSTMEIRRGRLLRIRACTNREGAKDEGGCWMIRD